MNNEVVSTLGITALAEPATAPAVARIGEALLEIEDLNVQFVTSHGTLRAVEGLSYTVHPGEMVAIVGESGSGKSVSALAVMQLLPSGTARTRGSIRFGGVSRMKPHARRKGRAGYRRAGDGRQGGPDLRQASGPKPTSRLN